VAFDVGLCTGWDIALSRERLSVKFLLISTAYCTPTGYGWRIRTIKAVIKYSNINLIYGYLWSKKQRYRAFIY
jgi:hypothetical protein